MEYLKAMSYYDATVYPSIEGVPIRLAIIKRNEWMAEQADLVIAYVKHSYGGAFRALMHARRKKKHIVNLAEQDQDK